MKLNTPWHRQGNRVKGEPGGLWARVVNQREKDRQRQAKEQRALEAQQKRRLDKRT